MKNILHFTEKDADLKQRKNETKAIKSFAPQVESNHFDVNRLRI